MGQVLAPWRATLTDLEHSLIVYGLVVAGLALLAMLIRTWVARDEVSGRFRPAVAASLGVLSVAFISYVVLVVKFGVGYDQVGAAWVPNGEAVWAWSMRYMDWSVTVPLLVVELLAVSTLRGRRAARTRAIGVIAAFAMISAGYLGGIAVAGGEDRTALAVWGLVGAVFFAALYAVVIMTVRRSLPALPSVARPTYRAAMTVLLGTWFVYPIVFGLQGATTGGTWATTGQLLLCAADVVTKIVFGLLIQKVAKLRTASDAQAGLEAHREALWVDGERHSEAQFPFPAEAGPTAVPHPAG